MPDHQSCLKISSIPSHAEFSLWDNTTLPTLQTIGTGTLNSMCLML